MVKSSIILLLGVVLPLQSFANPTEINKQLLTVLLPSTSQQSSSQDTTTRYYKSDFEPLGLIYLDDLEYVCNKDIIPIIKPESLSLQDRKNLEYYEPLIKQNYESPWYMKYISDRIGYGIFADDDIQPGQLIAEYLGIITTKEIMMQNSYYDMKYTWSIPAAPYSSDPSFIIYVDAKKSCNFTRFINHDYKPNVQAVIIYAQDGWHMLYVACKPIKKDGQLLVDYGKGYWANAAPDDLVA